MRKIFLCLWMGTVFATSVFAQEEEESEKLSFKEHLFTGGNVTASFFNGTTILGASPLLGYKFANWVDGGIVINFTYASRRDVREFDDKLKQSIYGGGIFTRLYPVNFLFIQGQFEHNFTKQSYRPSTSNYLPYKATVDANSFLLGAGYTQGRGPGSNTFYYLSILFDVIKNRDSPYVDLVYNDLTGEYKVRTVPVIRAGINIGLFEGRNRR